MQESLRKLFCALAFVSLIDSSSYSTISYHSFE